jgi:hypothetical protein
MVEPRRVQPGAYRTIHPIGMGSLPVGVYPARKRIHTMDRPDQFYTIENDEVRQRKDGATSTRFRKGAQIDLVTAAQYGFVDDQVAVLARPADEKPDVAETDELPEVSQPEGGARARGAAPENRSKRNGE